MGMASPYHLIRPVREFQALCAHARALRTCELIDLDRTTWATLFISFPRTACISWTPTTSITTRLVPSHHDQVLRATSASNKFASGQPGRLQRLPFHNDRIHNSLAIVSITIESHRSVCRLFDVAHRTRIPTHDFRFSLIHPPPRPFQMSLPAISSPPSGTRYDVIIVGGGVVGPALAYALSPASAIHKASPPHRTLRTLVIDSRLREPDRIVGELLQPGGVLALNELGMAGALENMEAVRAYGYCIVRPKSAPATSKQMPQFENVHIPYPEPHEGRSFHHGRFVQNLRRMAASAPGVELLEATVSSSLVSCEYTGTVIGVRATPSGSKAERRYLASMVVIANGSSNFRKSVFIPISPALTPTYRPLETSICGSFHGLILRHPAEDPTKPILPIPYHGTVVLIPGCGPILLYQISPTETRLLVDIPKHSPQAKNVEQYIREVVLPAFPTPELKESLLDLIEDEEPSESGKIGLKKWLRSMPNPFFPAPPQGRGYTREGVVILGDSWNQRHPLTGGGMTVGLSDVVRFARGVSGTPDIQERVFGGKAGAGGDWGVVEDVLEDMWWDRKGVAATVNILSVALYDLFKGDGEFVLLSEGPTLILYQYFPEGEELQALQTGCFKYFELGGEMINGPVTLLAGYVASGVEVPDLY